MAVPGTNRYALSKAGGLKIYSQRHMTKLVKELINHIILRQQKYWALHQL